MILWVNFLLIVPQARRYQFIQPKTKSAHWWVSKDVQSWVYMYIYIWLNIIYKMLNLVSLCVSTRAKWSLISKAVKPPIMLMSLDQHLKDMFFIPIPCSCVTVVSEIRALKTHICSSSLKAIYSGAVVRETTDQFLFLFWGHLCSQIFFNIIFDMHDHGKALAILSRN